MKIFLGLGIFSAVCGLVLSITIGNALHHLLGHEYLVAAALVLFVFVLDLATLWCLTKVGGPLQADAKATVKRFGGNIAIAASGLVGAFLAIAFVAGAMLAIIIRLLASK